MGNCCFGQEKKQEKRKSIPKKIRNAVWLEYHGFNEVGPCYCCGAQLTRNKGWHCAHVKAHDKGGETTVQNLRTCCRHCNLSMGNCNLYVYMSEKQLRGPGYRNMNKYLSQHKSQKGDRRTNNWGSG